MIVFKDPILFTASTFPRKHPVRSAHDGRPLQVPAIGRQDSCPNSPPGARTTWSQAGGTGQPYLESHSPGLRRNVRTHHLGS
jgi:hypothetical protein